MQRRSLVGATGLWAIGRRAVSQPARKLRRVGVVVSQFKVADATGPQTRSPPVNALLAGLRELGHVYGESFVTVPRSSEGKPERVPALAAELVAAQVDVIVAPGPALQQATSRDAGELDAAFAKARAARASALLVLNSGLLDLQAARIAALAATQRQPAMYGLRTYVERGGLKGALPGDLQVEQPTKFKLVMDLNAAKALGLRVPQSFLLRVDEVLQ